jgi:hypothetical protein
MPKPTPGAKPPAPAPPDSPHSTRAEAADDDVLQDLDGAAESRQDAAEPPELDQITIETGASLLLASVVRQAVTWVDVARITMQFLR